MGEEETVSVKTEEDLRQLAVDIEEGRVWTDRHCQSTEEVQMSFMILGLMDSENAQRVQDVVYPDSTKPEERGLIYEYYEKAGPRRVNGLPMFLSVQLLSPEETKVVRETVESLQGAKQEIIDG